ncbi:MAG: FFLEELY motif protein [Lysobacterales bacterium]
MSKAGTERLREMLARNHAIAAEVEQADFPQAEFNALQEWQRARLSRSFDDLAQQEEYRPAAHFFLSQLYGGLDFRQRDQDMGKVMPVMSRVLPDRTLGTMAEAFELQAISLEYDIRMARYMAREAIVDLDMERYCEVYRACSDRAGRERQIALIRKLGYDLDKLLRLPLVNYLVRLSRGPAHAAGFGKLQEFLEEGLAAFRALDDTHYFIETIYQRESDAMNRIFDGAPQPFGF